MLDYGCGGGANIKRLLKKCPHMAIGMTVIAAVLAAIMTVFIH